MKSPRINKKILKELVKKLLIEIEIDPMEGPDQNYLTMVNSFFINDLQQIENSQNNPNSFYLNCRNPYESEFIIRCIKIDENGKLEFKRIYVSSKYKSIDIAASSLVL